MKKWIAIVLALLMVLPLAACSEAPQSNHIESKQSIEKNTQPAPEDLTPAEPIPEFVADDYDEVGICGEDVQWGFKEDTGELVIIGTGPMEDYTSESAPWSNWEIESASIYGVSSIGDNAFFGCECLEDVTIEEGVTSIGAGAFMLCHSLSEFTIPDGVTTVGEWAFFQCSNMTEMTVPASLTTVGDNALGSCYNLTEFYYNGTREQFESIDIEYDKELLNYVTIHFES